MKVVFCEPMKNAEVREIAGDLRSLQESVGGYIEAVYPWEDPVALICNENGIAEGLELNRALRDDTGSIYDIICGPFLVVGLGEEDFTGLTDQQAEHYRKLFQDPEMFIRWNGRIVAIPA